MSKAAGPRKTQQPEAGRRKRRAPSSARAPRTPAVPAGLRMLRTSERGTLKFCEFKWHIEFQRNLKPLTPAPALRFGTLVHTALAQWYIPGVKRGMRPSDAFVKAYWLDLERQKQQFGAKVLDEATGDEKWVNALELGVEMLDNYLDEYGTDPDWEVIVTEHPFKVLVNHPETGKPWFWYTGILDGVWRNRSTRQLWIPDHKTTAGIGDQKTKYLQLDDQAGAYWSRGVDYLVQEALLKQTSQLNGMLYNFLRKALPDERQSKYVGGKRLYLNKDGSVSKKQPSPYFLRQPIFRDEYDRNEAKRRQEVDMRRIELFESGELELSKSPGQFTCPSCWVRDICELHETGADYESFIKDATHGWEPYAEHEIRDGR